MTIPAQRACLSACPKKSRQLASESLCAYREISL
jgi:hypothetical protein